MKIKAIRMVEDSKDDLTDIPLSNYDNMELPADEEVSGGQTTTYIATSSGDDNEATCSFISPVRSKQQTASFKPEMNEMPMKRKRPSSNSKFNHAMLELEKKKLKVLKKALASRSDNSEDMLFFRSLLPHVEKIPDHQKLPFQSQILSVVQRFVYQKPLE